MADDLPPWLEAYADKLGEQSGEKLARISAGQASGDIGAQRTSVGVLIGVKYQWSATLDDTTCIECADKDGEIVEDGDEEPPLHPECRCTLIPFDEGEEAPIQETYADWLDRQDEDTQQEMLGLARFRLYRDGELTLDRFVGRDGDLLTLKELRARDRDAFEAAGLERGDRLDDWLQDIIAEERDK